MASTFPMLPPLLGVLGVLGAVAPAAAESVEGPIEIEFDYRAPVGCPSEASAFSLVERRSQRVVRVPVGSGRERLAMTVVPSGAELEGRLTVTRTSGEREERSVVGRSCSEVVEALALTAALSIDPDATITLGPVEAEAPPSNDAPLSEDDSKVAREVPRESLREPVQVSVGPSFSIQQLLDTTVHLGGGLSVEVSRPGPTTFAPLEFWVNANVLADPNDPGSPGIASWFMLTRVGYCPLRVGERLAFLVCPSAQLGFVSATSQGVENAADSTRFFATLGLSGRLRADVSRHLRFWLAPSVDFPVTKRDFGVEPDPEPLVSTVDVSWDVAAGLSWTL